MKMVPYCGQMDKTKQSTTSSAGAKLALATLLFGSLLAKVGLAPLPGSKLALALGLTTQRVLALVGHNGSRFGRC